MLTALKTLWKLARYETGIVPCARREIRKWANAAEQIPDPILRSHATEAISVDARNAEAIAAFAAFAPRRQLRTTIELLVAYQILVDYVDTVGERVCADQVARGLRIGTALAAALAPPTSRIDLDPIGDDGGYLANLVAACRVRLWQLPSAAAIEQFADLAAIRCGRALAHTHTAAERGSLAQLQLWATRLNATDGYSWWEIAAGGNSSIAILALIAAASDPTTTACDAAQIATAYWPHICVMSTLLDSLVDHERDATSGNFSFVSHYPDHAAAQRGLVAATTNSLEATRTLCHSHTHAMIVCGVAAYYATAATTGLGAQIAPSLITALRPTVTPIVVALRVQRWVGG